MTILFGPAWLPLFAFAAVAASQRLPTLPAACMIVALSILGAAMTLILGADAAGAAQTVLLIVGVGGLVATLRYTVVTSRELRLARAEIARLAVNEERLRFARDLHDLLGHNLSLVALKCDLASQLVTASPEQAQRELQEAARVTRSALREVRETVAGYRVPTLAAELDAAAEIFHAAGIHLQLVGSPPSLHSTLQAALAWTVREGVTNVVKHSRAGACTIHFDVDPEGARVDIVDNGVVPGDADEGSPGDTGSGLAGLKERLNAVGGLCETLADPRGGFRLTAWVPLAPRQPTPAGFFGEHAAQQAPA